MPGVRFRTATVPDGGLAIPAARVEEERVLRSTDGGVTYILNPPAARRWGEHGDLTGARSVEWSLTNSPDGALVSAETGAEIDLLELTGEAATAFEAERPEPMTIVPAFRPMGGVLEIGEYLVGGRVLTGTSQIKKPIDSTSLSLYRTARLRGGPLWTGIAEHIADAAAQRVEQTPSLPHHMWSAGETHVRFVNDALLLLAAHADWSGAERFGHAVEAVSRRLDELSVELAGGRWILHDSLERDGGRNDLVLNTHIQAMVALMAAGRDIRGELAALEEVLAPRARGAAGLGVVVRIALAETVRGRGPRRLVRRRIRRAYERATRVAAESGSLRFPGGWIARDLAGRRTGPGRYLTVNLGDMAALHASMEAPPPWLQGALTEGLHFALRSGFFRAEIRDATPMSVLVPSVLRMAGRHDQAEAAANACRDAGLAPLVGWPGYSDALWKHLGTGAPL
jgi:hypothetical protein